MSKCPTPGFKGRSTQQVLKKKWMPHDSVYASHPWQVSPQGQNPWVTVGCRGGRGRTEATEQALLERVVVFYGNIRWHIHCGPSKPRWKRLKSHTLYCDFWWAMPADLWWRPVKGLMEDDSGNFLESRLMEATHFTSRDGVCGNYAWYKQTDVQKDPLQSCLKFKNFWGGAPVLEGQGYENWGGWITEETDLSHCRKRTRPKRKRKTQNWDNIILSVKMDLWTHAH